MNIVKFKGKENFKILHFSDIHYITEKDDVFFNDSEKIIKEENPDLIVLTGDIALGDDNLVAAKKVYGYFDKFNIPFTSVFGNHDCEWGSGKEEYFKIFQGYKNAVKIDINPKGYDFDKSVGNHIIKIGDNWDIYMIDDGWGYNKELVRWYCDNKPAKNGFCFMHIPFKEIENIHPEFCKETIGIGFEPPEYSRVCPLDDDLGLFNEFKKSNMRAAFFGHDHLNDYEGTVDGIVLGYTRTADYYCYNAEGTSYLDPCRNPYTTKPIERGCKVIVLKDNGFEGYSRLFNKEKIFPFKF